MAAAWIGALLVGLVLGLLGSGGSILTVPVLVYLVGEPDKLAIAESLGIVTIISLVGAIPFALKKLVSWRDVVLFGVPGMAGAYLGAWVSQFVPGTVQLALFAAVMLVAAVLMFRQKTKGVGAPGSQAKRAYWKVGLDGLAVGVLTGLVGVGGGFLIVPALVILGGLPMHLAVGTSLAIIAIKSASGFVKYVDIMGMDTMHWDVVLLFGALGIVGSFVGGKVGEYISQDRLKRGFAVFLVVMGVIILGQNVITLVGGADADAAPAVAEQQRSADASAVPAALADTLGLPADTLAAVETAIAEIDALRSGLATTFDPEGTVDKTTFRRVCKPVKMRAMAVAKLHGWRVQQLSAKNRNPAHALDAEAEAAHMRFVEHPEVTDFWIASTSADGTEGARYFRRITVEPACLACHGAKDERPAFVVAGYPEDKAYGFDVGDLRGVYSVFVPQP
jgi:uncharacterized membrane protein YfcA